MSDTKLNFCPNCGNELGPNKTFCIKCGKNLDKLSDFNKKSENFKDNTKLNTDSNNKSNTFIDKKKKNHKVIIGVILIIILAIITYQFVYVPYNIEQNNIKYEEGLKEASDFEKEADIRLNEFESEHENDMHSISTDADREHYTNDDNNFYFNDYLPSLKKEIEMLNDTLKYTNGNQTKIDFINYQIERLEIEYTCGENHTEIFSEILDEYYRGDYDKVRKDFTDDSLNHNNSHEKLKSWSIKLNTLLNNNPEFNQRIKDYDLYYEFYGDFKNI